MIKPISLKIFCYFFHTKYWITLLLFKLSFCCFSQVNFQINPSFNQLNLRSDLSPSAFADINGDGWDDLVYVNDKGNLEVILFDKKTEIKKIIETSMSNNLCYTINIADIDNDGINEIMTAGEYNGFKIFRLTAKQDSLLLQYESEANFFAQGSNFADINNDSFIDLFICNDDGLSKVFINDGKGNFREDLEIIDLSTKLNSDNSGNYASEWTDFDLDGDIDLYIAKCRVGVDDPTDPRRINVLYENKGEEGFHEVAKQYGLAVSDQSWTINFADFDLDGDMDAFVANHDAAHKFFENIGAEQYVERPNILGDLRSFTLHSIVRDFDNNGFEDIFITGDRSYFIFNQGNFEFDIVRNPIAGYSIAYFSTADYDKDGFLDFYASYLLLKSDLPNFTESLWRNQGNENNWVGFHLIGKESNANGIGATLELFGTWGKQTKQLKAGESYGLMNSLNMNFGIGTANQIDSLKITWPSGIVDVHKSINPNNYYQITEGVCITNGIGLNPSQTLLCEKDTIVLGSPFLPLKLDWSDGQQSNVYHVTKPSLLYAKFQGENACSWITNPILFNSATELDDVQIVNTLSNNLCAADQVILNLETPNSELSYEWSDGTMGNLNSISESGTYHVTAKNDCHLSQDSIDISFISFDPRSIQHDTIAHSEDAILVSHIDGISQWYEICEECVDPFFEGDTLLIENVTAPDSFKVVQDIQLTNFGLQIGLDSLYGTNPFRDTDINGSLIFDVYQRLKLQSVNVYAQTSGKRSIWVLNQDREIIHQKTMQIDTGLVTVKLDFVIEKGSNYLLSTNADSNLVHLGSISPLLGRANDQVKFPYSLDQLLTIKNSNLGVSFYPYFFNWKISGLDSSCVFESKAYIFLEEPSRISEIENKTINISPNPSNGHIDIKSKDAIIEQIEIYDITGKRHIYLTVNKNIQSMDLSALPKGLYFIVSKTNAYNQHFVQKLIIQ